MADALEAAVDMPRTKQGFLQFETGKDGWPVLPEIDPEWKTKQTEIVFRGFVTAVYRASYFLSSMRLTHSGRACHEQSLRTRAVGGDREEYGKIPSLIRSV